MCPVFVDDRSLVIAPAGQTVLSCPNLRRKAVVVGPFRGKQAWRSRSAPVAAGGGSIEDLADKLGAIILCVMHKNCEQLRTSAIVVACVQDVDAAMLSLTLICILMLYQAGDDVYADLNGWRLYLRDMKSDGSKTMGQVGRCNMRLNA